VEYYVDVGRVGSASPLLEPGIQRESKGDPLLRCSTCTASNAGYLVWTSSDLGFLDENVVRGTGSIWPDSVENGPDFTFWNSRLMKEKRL
jgi:hypothetical protein